MNSVFYQLWLAVSEKGGTDPLTMTARFLMEEWLSHHIEPSPPPKTYPPSPVYVAGTYSRFLYGSFSYFSIELIFNYLKYDIFIFY